MPSINETLITSNLFIKYKGDYVRTVQTIRINQSFEERPKSKNNIVFSEFFSLRQFRIITLRTEYEKTEELKIRNNKASIKENK